MFQVQVRHRIPGRQREEPEVGPLLFDVLNEQLTVRELIVRTVEEQIRDLLINRRLDSDQTARILQRQYLTDQDIQQQFPQGVIRLPSEQEPVVIQPEVEIQRALRAFERTAYIIVVDGQQAVTLDEEIRLHPGSKIAFVRLMPLVGG